VNFGTPVPLLIGIILILGALALFFLEKFRPGYERDSDKVYAVLLLISGLFLLAHLDMELLASFQQLLMAGMLTTLLIESVRSRLPNTDPRRPDNRMDPPRPPRPQYNERPPIRRGYRAELDDRGMFREPYQPRPQMNPAREATWDEYAPAGRQRAPYEEYRAPAGRLQPSRQANGPSAPPNAGPPQNRYSDNERYGERPPAPRPIQERSPERGGENGQYDRRPPQAPPANSGSAQRPPERSPERPPERDVRAERMNDAPRERPAKGERSLDVRPYSEAPKLNDDYRPGSQPEGTPS